MVFNRYRLRSFHPSGGAEVRRLADAVMRCVQEVPMDEQLGINFTIHNNGREVEWPIGFGIGGGRRQEGERHIEWPPVRGWNWMTEFSCLKISDGFVNATTNGVRRCWFDGSQDLPQRHRGAAAFCRFGGALCQASCCPFQRTIHSIPCLHSVCFFLDWWTSQCCSVNGMI